jgi:hypothetical protein
MGVPVGRGVGVAAWGVEVVVLWGAGMEVFVGSGGLLAGVGVFVARAVVAVAGGSARTMVGGRGLVGAAVGATLIRVVGVFTGAAVGSDTAAVAGD